MKFLHSDKAPAAIGPYSQGTMVGKHIYVSGQLPIVNGELQTDVEKATQASLDNVLAVVEAAGGSKKDIARVGVFVKDLNDFAKVNEVYAAFFGEHKPARACVEVARLPKDAVIEIEAIAFVE